MIVKNQTQQPSNETAEEIVGVLTAISIVANRLAKKLRLMEQAVDAAEGGAMNGQDE